MLKKRITILLIALSFNGYGQEKDSVAYKYSKTITTADLTTYLTVLASDEYEGRETGEKGQKMASDYIAQKFIEFGIPAVNNTYLQEFELQKNKRSGTLTIGTSVFNVGEDIHLQENCSYFKQDYSELVFVGYGVDGLAYTNYGEEDVTGKIVVAVEGEPVKRGKYILSGDKKPSDWTKNSELKIGAAVKHGASCLIIIKKELNLLNSIGGLLYEDRNLELVVTERKSIPVLFVSERVGKELLKATGKSVAELRGEKSPQAQLILENIKIDVSDKERGVFSTNVLGYIEGTDLKEELVVVTAHYDHLGLDGQGGVYNGADDDGSGTAAILEMAQAFAIAKAEGKGSRRSVLFMTVSGEEKGLLGSDYYTQHPVFPLENTVTNLNIDMVGRKDDTHGNFNFVYLIGSDKLSTELHALSEQVNTTYTNLELDYTYNDPEDPNRFYYRSDHYNFAKNNIPVIFYFNGVHEDYHKTTDTVEKINFEALQKRTLLVYFTAWELANRDKRVVVDVNLK